MDLLLFDRYLKETQQMVKENRHIAEHAYMRDVYLDSVRQAPKAIVELGVREGMSTRTMAKAASLFGGWTACIRN